MSLSKALIKRCQTTQIHVALAKMIIEAQVLSQDISLFTNNTV